MISVGTFHGAVLLVFWLGGLAAFLLGGMEWTSHVFQAFLATVFLWLVRALVLEYKGIVVKKIEQDKAFAEWEKRQKRSVS